MEQGYYFISIHYRVYMGIHYRVYMGIHPVLLFETWYGSDYMIAA
jgi:hypothetical protein